LRQVLGDAKSGKTIILDQQKIGTTITLQSDLNFMTSVVIQGNGVALRGPSGQHIHIFPGVNVTMNELVIRESQSAKGNMAQGGVIFNQGILTLKDSVVSGNRSNYNGGALVNTLGGHLVLDHTVFKGNAAEGYGGAIYNSHGSVSIINDSRIEHNTSRGGGGGLYSTDGPVTITHSQVIENTAGYDDSSRYYGGGLAIRNGSLSLTSSSRIEGNTVYGDGGGLSLLDASAILNASTITDNTARTSSNILFPGGGGMAVEISTADHPPMQALIIGMPITDQPGTSSTSYLGKNHIQRGRDTISDPYWVSSQWRALSKEACQAHIKESQPPLNCKPASYQNSLGQRLGDLQGAPYAYLQAIPVTIGYPPPADPFPEKLPNYLGTFDIDAFCQTKGYSHGEPWSEDLSHLVCASSFSVQDNSQLNVLAKEACAMRYHGKFTDKRSITARLYDYYDLSSWECYRDVEQITTINLTALNWDQFCKAHGLEKGLLPNKRQTAYDWECQNTDGTPLGISVTDVCRSLTKDPNAFDRLARFDDPNGWECWRPASS
jgi:predicted outer membrane repeat protein